MHCSVFCCRFILLFVLLKERKTTSALQPLAIREPTDVHCPQVCVWVCVRECVRVCVIKMCQGHCAVGFYLNRRLYIKVNILIASIAGVCGLELCFGSLSVYVGVCVWLCELDVWWSASDTTQWEKMRVFLLKKKKKSLPWDRSLYTVNFLESSPLKPLFVNLQFWGKISRFHFRKKNHDNPGFYFGGWIWVRTLQVFPIRRV